MTDRRLNLKLFRNVSFLQNGELTNGSMVSAIWGKAFTDREIHCVHASATGPKRNYNEAEKNME